MREFTTMPKFGTPVAPSDTAKNYYDFLERNRKEWGLAKHTFIDSADAATITELNSLKENIHSVYMYLMLHIKL